MVGNPVAGVLGGGGAARHRARPGAGELLAVAGVVGEGDLHVDGLARIGGNKGVAAGGGAVDLGVVGEPLVGEGSVAEAVVVGYAGGVGGEGLAHLGGAGDGGRTCGRVVGRRGSRGHRARPGAGELLVVAGVVGEGHPHFDGLARVGGNKGVAAGGGAVDLGVVGEPLVGEGSVVEAVIVGYAGGVGGEGLAHLGGAGDGGQPGGRGVGRRRSRGHRARPGAGELLAVAGVVGEGHPHFDGLALVVGQGVGGSVCPVDLSVVGEPLVGEGSVVEAVIVGYAGGVGGEGLAHLGGAGDGGQPGGRGVGRRRSRGHRARPGAGELLVVAGVVGEGDLHFDRLALVVVGQGVGGSVCPVDLSVVGEPLVGEGSVVEAVGVFDAGGVGGEGLAHLGGAGDGGRTCGRTITGTAQVGETLTADTSGISDDDGLGNAAFAYQWLADDAEINGANASTYTLADDDEGKAIKVRVSFTDDAGNGEQLTSAVTGAVAAAPPPPNNAATGAPTITGTAQVGETLTADTSGISDDDGLGNAAFAYQWLADDAEINGANASTYTLADDDEGKAIKVKVSFTDDAGNDEQLTSAGTGPVAPAPPLPNTPATGLPTITGTAQVGETLTADTTGISDDDDGLDNAAFAYQWLADDAEINGANASTYTLADDDEGKAIKVKVSFTDDAGNDEQLTSAVTGAVAASPPPPNTPATGLPTITGTAQVGETLTADTTGISDDDGLDNAAFAYQWLADDAEIDSATASSYTLADADAGKAIKVKVTFTDDAGNGEQLTSAGTGAVAAAPPPPNTPATGLPTITGTAQVGDTLTAVTSGIEDADGLDNATFAYQWLADDAEINGANASTYTLADDDEGKAIKVKVSFTDDAGNDEQLTSAATGAVAPAVVNPPLTASAHDVPSSHDGSATLIFELRFSEEPKTDFSYKTLRDHAFTVTGGTVVGARRLDRPGNIRWEISVSPDSNGDVTVVLPATTDCEADGAICTEDDRKLSNRLELSVNGPGQ